MKTAKVIYLKKVQSHFNEAMRLNGERDGIRHACAEIAAYIDAHQAAGVYMPDNKSAIMYCAGVKGLYNKSWGKEQKSGQSKPNQVKWKCKNPQPEEGILCPRKIIAQNS